MLDRIKCTAKIEEDAVCRPFHIMVTLKLVNEVDNAVDSGATWKVGKVNTRE